MEEDVRLQAQLTAPKWKLRGVKIQVEAKEDIKKRLGSSTDDADALIMAWFFRERAASSKFVLPARKPLSIV